MTLMLQEHPAVTKLSSTTGKQKLYESEKKQEYPIVFFKYHKGVHPPQAALRHDLLPD